VMKRSTIADRLAQYSDLLIERCDEHAIVGTQLFDKSNGTFLNFIELEFRRVARVQQERDCEWLLRIFEKGNLLLDAVLIETKLLSAQIGNKSSLTIHDIDRDGDEVSADAHDIDVPRLLRRWRSLGLDGVQSDERSEEYECLEREQYRPYRAAHLGCAACDADHRTASNAGSP